MHAIRYGITNNDPNTQELPKTNDDNVELSSPESLFQEVYHNEEQVQVQIHTNKYKFIMTNKYKLIKTNQIS